MRKALILGLIAFLTSIFVVYGDIIPTLSSVTGSSPNFTWNYRANVTVDETAVKGDFFTIYDFSSIQPTITTQPSGWTFSTALVGPTPNLVTPTDNPSLWNLTWTYTGSSPINGSAFLGIFSVLANTNQLQAGQFAAAATRTTDGTPISNIGQVSVPVPESTSLLPLIGVCAAALLVAPRLRRARA